MTGDGEVGTAGDGRWWCESVCWRVGGWLAGCEGRTLQLIDAAAAGALVAAGSRRGRCRDERLVAAAAVASVWWRSRPARIASPPHDRRHAGARPTASRRTAAPAAPGQAVLPDLRAAIGGGRSIERLPPRSARRPPVLPSRRRASAAPQADLPPSPPLCQLTAWWQAWWWLPRRPGGGKVTTRSRRRLNLNGSAALAPHASPLCPTPQAHPPHGHSCRLRSDQSRGGRALLSFDVNSRVWPRSAGPSTPASVPFFRRTQLTRRQIWVCPFPYRGASSPHSWLQAICPLPSLSPRWSNGNRLAVFTLPTTLQATAPSTSLGPARTTRPPRSTASTLPQHPVPCTSRSCRLR